MEHILRISSQRAAGWTVKQASRRRDFSKFSCHTGSCLAYTWRPDLLLRMFCYHYILHNCSMDSELNDKEGACKKFCSRSCGIEFMSIQAKEPNREDPINSVQFKCYLELGDMLAISRVVCLFNLTLYASPLQQNMSKMRIPSEVLNLNITLRCWIIVEEVSKDLVLKLFPRVGHSS